MKHFDYNSFNYALGKIEAQTSKLGYTELLSRVAAVRIEHSALTKDPIALTYVERAANRVMLLGAIFSEQNWPVVLDWFNTNAQMGFVSLLSEVYATIHFADYSRDCGQAHLGLTSLHHLRTRLLDSLATDSSALNRFLTKELDLAIKRVKGLDKA